ncbi:AMP-binding protein [Caulobacter segnis]|uniref:AMP-dependent synthetase and ligase n=2 Tax=Caulobacter segnis TaxID=88688 RepID=D5VKG2_CAUST|nr:AMP-binding protein [Caulobacter segnis]ADG10985.1 AMP-dependent synthetase and ligase [Caulobacter segnis ATCC 21756]
MPIIDGEMQAFSLTLDKFLDHAAKWTPNAQVATAHEDGRIDRAGYADLQDRARRVSAVLEALGVRGGDRVATLAWNSQAHVEAWFAIMGIGAVCHTLNPRLTAEQLAAMVVQSEARIVIASADLAPLARNIRELAPHIARLLIIDGEAEGGEALAPMIDAEARRAVWGRFEETAPCGLCFTSGTTGAPKGVTYTHRSSYLHTLRILQADGMAISGADAVLAVVPMFHANAWGLPFAAPAVGAKLVLPGRNTDGASLARLIAAEDVTIGVGVPTVWSGLMDHIEATGLALPSLKRIIVGGAPMPPALMARLEQRLGVRVQTSWGMTELSPCGVLAPLSSPGDAAVAGRPAVGVDLLLTDADGVALTQQRGVEGHLRVRGASVVARYFGQEGPATDAQGWFATGDLARIADDGVLIITGRSKDLIKSGGEWINPAEIEALVCALPEVSQAAVIGRSHPKWGERPILLVEAQGDISDETLLGALRGRVANWWLPDAVYRLPRMPLAATGKIDKLRLRSEYGVG